MTSGQASEAVLRIAEARPRDVGRGIARIDASLMGQLGLVSGDVVQIEGKVPVPAIAWPGYPEDAGRQILRVDGSIRGNLQAGIDDKVTVRQAEARKAKKITVSPNQRIKIAGGADYVRRVLEGRPVVKGQTIGMQILGNPLTFTVTVTEPSGTVLVSRTTQVVVSTEVVEERKPTRITYEDIGGLRREIDLVREMVELPLRRPELFQRIGIEPPKGVLLYGPPGTGKTLIAKAVANETFANFIFVSGPEIMAKYYGESEERIRQIFQQAEANSPAIIFIDEFDSIAPKREDVSGEKQVERRVVAQLLALMDGLKSRGEVIVIAATNKPELIDEALRRGGRFDREIEIGVPDRNGRMEILQIHTRGMPLAEDIDLEDLADVTYGFVGADIASLCKEAAMHALRKIARKIDIEKEIPPEVLDEVRVTRKDFDHALKNVEPSAMREVFVEVPKVRWGDVGGLEEAKTELVEAVEWPLKYPEAFEMLGTRPPSGILLFGAPGTGKTLLAKAVATESQTNFIAIKGPELFNRYVGESERAVREIFRKAKQVAPAIVFFDEIESLAQSRSGSPYSPVADRVVSQLLSELDGIEDMKEVVVLAATNRPDLVDPALLRPGRLERLIHVPIPDERERSEILRVHLAGKPLAPDVDEKELARAMDGYVGSDIEALCRRAAMLALREFMKGSKGRLPTKENLKGIAISRKHFDVAMRSLRPVALQKNLNRFEEIARSFAGTGSPKVGKGV